MYIVCQTLVKSKKVSVLGEDGCDKLLQAAIDRWERCDYGKIDVIDTLRLLDLKHNIAKEKRFTNTTDLVFQVSCLHST